MKQKIIIKPALLSNMESVKEVLAECNLPTDGLKDHFDYGYCVAVYEKKIVGAAGIEIYSPYGLLRSVSVSQAWQNNSIGESLVKDRLTWAKSKGLVGIYLLTIDAAKFFEKLGFYNVSRDSVPSEIRNSREFCSVCPESATVMKLSITLSIK